MATQKESVFRFAALGTEWYITTDKRLSLMHERQILALVYDFQSNYSRFESSSFVSKLNTEKVLENPPLEMVSMVRFAMQMYDLSDGLFNISVGAKLEQSGYGKVSDVSARISTNLDTEIDISPTLIRIAPHIRLDFGGFGKGWLVDKIHDYLKRHNYRKHIVNGGGDIRVGDVKESIYVENPTVAGEVVGQVMLNDEAFAASSPLKRQWRTKNGGVKSHIIHPGSQANHASMPLQICTKAKTCAKADVAATVLLLLTEQERLVYADRMDTTFMELLPDSVALHAATYGLQPV